MKITVLGLLFSSGLFARTITITTSNHAVTANVDHFTAQSGKGKTMTMASSQGNTFRFMTVQADSVSTAGTTEGFESTNGVAANTTTSVSELRLMVEEEAPPPLDP